jgi:hypothetical protein
VKVKEVKWALRVGLRSKAFTIVRPANGLVPRQPWLNDLNPSGILGG